jgi:hypothetical protein
MPTLMLVNPRKRRSSGVKRRRTTTGTKRRTRRTRRANPVSVASVRRRVRRASTGVRRSARRVTRRRRNPISMRSLSGGSIMNMLKTAAIGGMGAISMDLLMAKVNQYLPASLQASAGPGIHDVVRIAITIAAGKALSKPTRGLSEKMAAGALTVQMARVLTPMVAKVLPVASSQAAVAGRLGYMVPNPVVRGNARVSPMQMQRYVTGAKSPLLAAYTRGASPLLSSNTRRVAR